MKNNKLQLIKEKIWKANPEILEEKSVCKSCNGWGKEICDNPDHGFINAMIGVRATDIGRLGCPVCGHDEYHRTKDNCGDCKGERVILGRDITLPDVLLAIGIKNNSSILKVNSFGGFSWFIDNEWKDVALPRWNLLKNLDDQSEETLDFLYELLK